MADPTISRPQQHSQPSRKGKRAWRKNVDLNDLETGLEELREEVIKGGPVSEKASSELFITDTAGSDQIRSKYTVGRKLKADEILAARSAVPAVASRKRKAVDIVDEEWAGKVAEVKGRVTNGVIPAKRLKTDHVSHREYEKLRKLAYGGDTQHKDIVTVGEEGATYDPWDATTEHNGVGYGWVEKTMPVREPVTLKRKPISLEKHGKEIPAVLKPDAGKSYNPAFTDWDALIQREGVKELDAERLRQAEAAREREIEGLREEARQEEALEKAGYSSNWESEWESEWEGIMSEKEEQEWLSKKRPERKTKAERNKIARRKEEERRRVHEEKIKEREKQLTQVKILATKAKEKEAMRKMQPMQATKEESSEDDVHDVELRRRRLGAHHVPEGPLELVLADELQDSLRLLKPEGDLVGDRFRSMVVRGKVESRKKILQHKKRNGKATEKWSYKDWKLK